MRTPPVPFEGSIEEKITWAETCLKHFQATRAGEETLSWLLTRLQEAITGSRDALYASGISRICRECDLEEGGSCCAAGLENRYDPWLLLTNLFLGLRLPRVRRHSGDCLFLGEGGCRLAARHTLCVNYLCRKIEERIAPGRLEGLREEEGREQVILFQVIERLKHLAGI